MENIKLKGAKNIRDFGGIMNCEGKLLKPRCFLRGNALNNLHKPDIEKLVNNYNLGIVIDLRTNTETEEKPDKEIPGVKYIHIPIINESTVGISHENETDKKAALNHLPDLSELYRSIVTDPYSVNQIKKVFKVITDNDSGKAILWHCTEGKDRCGLISALFLSLLDADVDTIYKDYLFTNKASSKNANKYSFLVLLISGSVKKARKIKQVFRAEPEYLDAAFSAINDTYRDVNGFLKNALGITDEIKSKMKEKYLEQPCK